MAQLDPTHYKRLSSSVTYGQSDGLYWDATNSQLVLVVAGTTYAVITAAGITADLEVSGETRGDILRRGASSWEVVAAKNAGQVLLGNGTDVISAALSGAIASISAAGAVALSPTGLPASVLQIATGTIPSADITDVAAGKLGHAAGYPVVSAVGAHNVPEFISGLLIHDYAGAAYTDGGNLFFSHSGGGSTLSGVVSAANSLGAAADKVTAVWAGVPTNNLLVENAGINIASSAAFTNPGGATGVLRYVCMYRVHATGL